MPHPDFASHTAGFDTQRYVDDVARIVLHINLGRTRTYLTRRQLVNQIPKNLESNCQPKA